MSVDIRGDHPLRALRLAALFEGLTLLLLVFVAVPLKHFGGLPLATALMGPVHGLAFVTYVWLLVRSASDGSLPSHLTPRLLLAAFIPFGALHTERQLRLLSRAQV